MIETQRLLLREHRIDDFAAYIPLWTQRLPGPDGGFRFPPLWDEEVWARLLRWIGHRQVFGFAPFLAFDLASGRLCGEVGFGHFHRGNGPAFDGVPETMWTLHPDFHGEGLAGEAATAAIVWFDSHFPSPRTVCMIEPDNTASLRLAERFGFREFDRGEYKGSLNIFLERLR
ncbi:GNAT family N-acetyltransferase [Rhizobium sp. LjRoot254]|uniref:GNAT family N-acetyltransferase n=1 Tax=Rhizobium sp. LjRoot254 TaxID=3342297 RepID=UPI003ECE2721